MGVSHLWRLLGSGKEISLQDLCEKRIAIDASIWIYRVVKGGSKSSLDPAAIIALVRRICRLLHFRIKAVFVFDGGKIPDLKKNALKERKDRRGVAESRLERLKRNSLLQAAIERLVKGEQEGPLQSRENLSDVSDEFCDSSDEFDSLDDLEECQEPLPHFDSSDESFSKWQISRMAHDFKEKEVKKQSKALSTKFLASDWTRTYSLQRNGSDPGFVIASSTKVSGPLGSLDFSQPSLPTERAAPKEEEALSFGSEDELIEIPLKREFSQPAESPIAKEQSPGKKKALVAPEPARVPDISEERNILSTAVDTQRSLDLPAILHDKSPKEEIKHTASSLPAKPHEQFQLPLGQPGGPFEKANFVSLEKPNFASLEKQSRSVGEEARNIFQQILSLFNIDFVVADGEAEVLCVALEHGQKVDAIASDDNDCFLFGAKTVVRNLFSSSCSVLSYSSRELLLPRKKLIFLAYLLGSDYCSGVKGIGVKKALRLLQNINELSELRGAVSDITKEPPPEYICKCEIYDYYWNARDGCGGNEKFSFQNYVKVEAFARFMREHAHWEPEKSVRFISPILKANYASA